MEQLIEERAEQRHLGLENGSHLVSKRGAKSGSRTCSMLRRLRRAMEKVVMMMIPIKMEEFERRRRKGEGWQERCGGKTKPPCHFVSWTSQRLDRHGFVRWPLIRWRIFASGVNSTVAHLRSTDGTGILSRCRGLASRGRLQS